MGRRPQGRRRDDLIATAADPFAALGDGNRRRVLELVAAEPRSVVEIANEMPISRPAVSRHLRILKQAELVDVENEGARRVYRLSATGLMDIRSYMERLWGDAIPRFKLLADNLNSDET